MPAETIIDLRKPGFPVYDATSKSYRTSLEYVGPFATLEDEKPDTDDVWGEYLGRVKSTRLTPLEGSTYGELSVVCEYFFEDADGSGGTAREVTYEVEWVMFQRSYYEHPKFAIGGGGTYELDSEDVADIEAWNNEPNPGLRGAYQIDMARIGDTSGGPVKDLSTAAKMFARGIELGQEFWEDYLPVIRMTTNFFGGNPSTSSAGSKGGDPSFTGKPSGYEWRKTADRAVKAGGQTRWERVEEWTGAPTILADKTNIYWSAP